MSSYQTAADLVVAAQNGQEVCCLLFEEAVWLLEAIPVLQGAIRYRRRLEGLPCLGKRGPVNPVCCGLRSHQVGIAVPATILGDQES